LLDLVLHPSAGTSGTASGRLLARSSATPRLAFHDLRHSALTIDAEAGATLAELQAHAGHSTVDAALRYQHATQDRAVALAAAVDVLINLDSTEPSPPSGP
jgi:integrase